MKKAYTLADIEAIVYLARNTTNSWQEVLQFYEDFLHSKYNLPQFTLEECMDSYLTFEK